MLLTALPLGVWSVAPHAPSGCSWTAGRRSCRTRLCTRSVWEQGRAGSAHGSPCEAAPGGRALQAARSAASGGRHQATGRHEGEASAQGVGFQGGMRDQESGSRAHLTQYMGRMIAFSVHNDGNCAMTARRAVDDRRASRMLCTRPARWPAAACGASRRPDARRQHAVHLPCMRSPKGLWPAGSAACSAARRPAKRACRCHVNSTCPARHTVKLFQRRCLWIPSQQAGSRQRSGQLQKRAAVKHAVAVAAAAPQLERNVCSGARHREGQAGTRALYTKPRAVHSDQHSRWLHLQTWAPWRPLLKSSSTRAAAEQHLTPKS